jgi:hypothetical protein
MPDPRLTLRRVAGRLQSRFRNARPGSVLILVVALLVLMALIGTAWLSTARTDRHSAAQNSHNTQVELMVDGVVNMVKGGLVGDLVSGGQARPALSADATGYGHYDSVQSDPLLAPRVPVVIQEIAQDHAESNVAYGSMPTTRREYEVGQIVKYGGSYWVCTQAHFTGVAFSGTGLPARTGPPAPPLWYELGSDVDWDDTPVYAVGSKLVELAFEDISGRAVSSTPEQGSVAAFHARTFLFPSTIDFANNPQFPAFRFYHPDTEQLERVPAADTDGDGVADALLFRLPVGTLNGVDYFAAIRVVDNGSALNPSTAWDWGARTTVDFTADGTPPRLRLVGDFFPSNIRLNDIILDASEREDLIDYRGRPPVDPHPVPSPQFEFLSKYDHLWMHLGRRLENPFGFYRALPGVEAGTLAYKGGTLRNLDTSPSLLENLIPSDIYDNLYNAPGGPEPSKRSYSGQRAIADWWFNYNFDFNDNLPIAGADSITGSARVLLAVRNGVTSLIPVKTAGLPGSPLTPPPVTGPVPNLSVMRAYGAAPTKTAVNTVGAVITDASTNPPTWGLNSERAFEELWRAYWSVMAQEWSNDDTRAPTSSAFRYFEDNPAQANPAQVVGWLNDPYVGSKFTTGTYVATAVPQHPARMFRSPLRAVKPLPAAAEDPWADTTPRMGPDQTLLLRAALASVNTMDQRDLDEDVTFKKIPTVVRGITPAPPAVNAVVQVYGHERQPYLTEIFAHADVMPRTLADPPEIFGLRNPAGYIAIEFHNPYNFPIDISYCKLAAIDRTSATGLLPRMVLQDLSDVDGDGISTSADGDVVLSDHQSNLTDPNLYVDPNPPTPPVGAPPHKALIIPAYGYLVLENYTNPVGTPPPVDPRGTAAMFRPPSSGAPVVGPVNGAIYRATNFVYVPNLDHIYNREIVLVRPVRAEYFTRTIDGAATDTLVYGDTPTTDELSIWNMAPLDSYDFTGLLHPDPTVTPGSTGPDPAGFVAHAWHYARACPEALSPFDKLWKWVYPGRYDGNESARLVRSSPPTPRNARPRHQGTKEATSSTTDSGWLSGGMETDPWESSAGTPAPSIGGRTTSGDRNATYPTEFTIQMSNLGWAGPFIGRTGSPLPVQPTYPFGGFARNGDLLQVPYIGAYRIQTLADVDTAVILELNAVTIDSVFAEDTDIGTDPTTGAAALGTPGSYRPEQIGRFVPLVADMKVFGRGSLDDPMDNLPDLVTIEDDERTEGALIGFDVVITGGKGAGQVRPIIDYVQGTTTNPGRMSFSEAWTVPLDGSSTYEIRAGHYYWAEDLLDYFTVGSPHADFQPDTLSAASPLPVSNDGIDPANAGRENTAPTHGLININTAPWPVMAAVRWTTNPDINTLMAKAIVNYRDREVASGRVPFRTLMDLYRVPEFLAMNDLILLGNDDPGDSDNEATPIPTFEPDGDITPPDTFGSRVEDGVRRDFEEQFLMLTRVSNLITTRSDSFTGYVLVQGWRGIGTPQPELVVQRRRAFTADRSPVTEINRQVPIKYFYNE